MCIDVQPNFSPQALHSYKEGERLARLGRARDAKTRWLKLAKRYPRHPWLYPWLTSFSLRPLAQQKRWTQAEHVFEDAVSHAQGAGSEVLASLQRCWAWRLLSEGHYAESETHYKQAVELDRDGGKPNLALAADLMQLLWLSYQRPAAAEDYLREATAIEERLAPKSLELANSYIEAGSLLLRAGNLDQADEYFEPALAIEEEVGVATTYLNSSLMFLAWTSLQRGDLSKAEKYYRRTLAAGHGSLPNRNTALALIGLAAINHERGQIAKAQYYDQQALRVARKLAGDNIPYSVDIAESLRGLGDIAADNREFVRAEKYYLDALRIQAKSAPGSHVVADTLCELGYASLHQGHTAMAENYFRRSLAIGRKLAPAGNADAIRCSGLGDTFERSGDLARAEETYRESLAILEKAVPESATRAGILAALGHVLRREHKWDEAGRDYKQALDILETATSRSGSGMEARSDFRANHQNPYREFVDLLVQQHQPENAFEVLERSRARSLVEMLNTGHIDIRKGVDPALLEQQRSLQQKLTEKSYQRIHLLSGPYSEEQLKQLDKEIADLTSQRQDVEGQIQSTTPAYAALTQPQPLSAKEIQQQLLDPDTVLLEYSLGDDRSYLFTLTPDTLHSYELPSRKKIERVARRVYALLTTRDHPVRGETRAQRQIRLRSSQQAYQYAASDLSRMILTPAADELQGKRLLIVSDGALAYIPFAALPNADGAPLTSAPEIVNLPSASALAMLRQQEQTRIPAAKSVAVLADPVFSKNDPRVQLASHPIRKRSSKERTAGAQEGDQTTENGLNRDAAASSPQISSWEANLPAYLLSRSVDDVKPSGRLHLYRLPFTRQEAQAIAAAVPPAQGLQALDFQASRATATSPDLAQYRIVHFATHGLLDSRHPELSGLVLSLVDEHGQPQNGFLELQDIYNLNLSADLVVLSACETALGKEVDGEGLVGLTRGFMYAGTNRVLASLWRVDDEATAQLMKKFYQGVLQEGKTPAQALHQAQLWMQSQKRWRQPYYWAGFVLQGEWK